MEKLKTLFGWYLSSDVVVPLEPQQAKSDVDLKTALRFTSFISNSKSNKQNKVRKENQIGVRLPDSARLAARCVHSSVHYG